MIVHSNEGFTGGNGPRDDCVAAAASQEGSPVIVGFAEKVESIEIREERWELLREAKWWLAQWETHRSVAAREELRAALAKLSRLVE